MARYVILALAIIAAVVPYIGFDCDGGPLNVTTISLRDVGDCDMETRQLNTTRAYIQLLQAAEYQTIPYIQNKVMITRTVYYCGMHSHIYMVNNGVAEYLFEPTVQKCETMHLTGTFIFVNGVNILALKVNSTTSHSITLAGKAGVDRSCSGSQYSDQFGSWMGVVVLAILLITLKSGYIPVKISSGKVTLRSGIVCQLKNGHCLDPENGYTFWNIIAPYRLCDFSSYDVLYEGPAERTIDMSDPQAPEVYSLTTKETTFALARTTETKLCGFSIHRTEHPELFIIETQPGVSFIQHQSISIENLDIFTYVNCKFIFVEKHLRTQITELYNNIISQKCELERQVLQNALADALRDPVEFAYTKDRDIPPCKRVRTRILKKVGSEGKCNVILPTEFLSEHGWIRLTPDAIDVSALGILKPEAVLSWKYTSPSTLATSGIYTSHQIEQLKDHLMLPPED
ncbi:hypothetical protein M0804_013844 [Polistes exclamans]|nr:hypothetical protein M0804_013844 [Polistes exclamans]